MSERETIMAAQVENIVWVDKHHPLPEFEPSDPPTVGDWERMPLILVLVDGCLHVTKWTGIIFQTLNYSRQFAPFRVQWWAYAPTGPKDIR